ncbi:xanthine dehydrogenase accessory protein XdhC [Nitratireductor kimnyeongensis]|uniref:Xanthine dehydrogenase accessory protein XdhC n=1 Tax=Nitratireductor kimnyeongensis TaxID=430679 RepID=A0ABW0T7K4_9HYPH|nr:xanthine dehydrogenase accessory protein XdhC [Nitratireductor kimnyeongensis]QZZ36360.1 xanthine dehydrogenase accessory protein XdhC [Nitratireductor kimnyeongensis]
MAADPTSGLGTFLQNSTFVALVEVCEAKGSTPREEGAWMLVSPKAIFGTIGGGQLEFMAIAKARELIADNLANGALDIPLGPEIGQCCGGRVALDIRLLDQAARPALVERAAEEASTFPQVILFGGGHVGHALASALTPLPVRVRVIETRKEAIEDFPDHVETRLTALPEEAVRDASAGTAFVILTHDHALDFLLVAEALARDDAAYVGMIGSKTKRATFKSWYLKNGGDEHRFSKLVTPIGGNAVHDKRPAVIAAMAAAEILVALQS